MIGKKYHILLLIFFSLQLGLADFLLDQKARMEISQKKLKQKEVLDMYKDTNKFELTKSAEQENEEDGVDLNSSVGVLVDKKTG